MSEEAAVVVTAAAAAAADKQPSDSVKILKKTSGRSRRKPKTTVLPDESGSSKARKVGPRGGSSGLTRLDITEAQRESLRAATHRTARKMTCEGLIIPCDILDSYDGDSITVKFFLEGTDQIFQEKVRLAWVDTPEMRVSKKDPNRDLHAKAARAARRWVRHHLEGCDLWLHGMGNGKFTRWLGVVEYQHREDPAKKGFLNHEMLRAGVARPFDGKKKRPLWTIEQLDHILKVAPEPIQKPVAVPAVEQLPNSSNNSSSATVD
jgi:endonuclease YncB( thermonuclease family)